MKLDGFFKSKYIVAQSRNIIPALSIKPTIAKPPATIASIATMGIRSALQPKVAAPVAAPVKPLVYAAPVSATPAPQPAPVITPAPAPTPMTLPQPVVTQQPAISPTGLLPAIASQAGTTQSLPNTLTGEGGTNYMDYFTSASGKSSGTDLAPTSLTPSSNKNIMMIGALGLIAIILLSKRK